MKRNVPLTKLTPMVVMPSDFRDHELVELQTRIGTERKLRLIVELQFRLASSPVSRYSLR